LRRDIAGQLEFAALFVLYCRFRHQPEINLMPIALAITPQTVQIVAGIGAVLLIVLAIMRHKRKSKKESEDEF
jgi:hypothetical protein